MEKTKTERGFALRPFVDANGEKCSIQKSSVATEDMIWLGVEKPTCQVLTDEGWVDLYSEEEQKAPNMLFSGRMHLTRKQVAALLPSLIKFVLTGRL